MKHYQGYEWLIKESDRNYFEMSATTVEIEYSHHEGLHHEVREALMLLMGFTFVQEIEPSNRSFSMDHDEFEEMNAVACEIIKEHYGE